jgi:AcrR family transcriptional regulator
MKKGEESRQRLIECAAELFWKNGYSATGISEILKQTGLPKGSFYFYFKSKDDLATAVTEYYQKILLEQFRSSSQGNDWESFIEEIFDYLFGRATGQTFAGCPYAVMGMETALSKPAVASVFMEGLKNSNRFFRKYCYTPDCLQIMQRFFLSVCFPSIRDIFFLDESATILSF